MEYFKILYRDENVISIDKPAGVIVFSEGKNGGKTLIDYLLEKLPELKNVGKPPRYGIVHRLDKDTSGILVIAENDKTLEFLQKQFKERRVEKKYIGLVASHLKNEKGIIETLIGRSSADRRKQKVFLPGEPDSQGKRTAATRYKVLRRFENFDLVEITPKTGRKHQIRCHFAYLGHPIVGDKVYGFKNQIPPKGLKRHFLHATYLKIKLPDGKEMEFKSELPENLKKFLEDLKIETVK